MKIILSFAMTLLFCAVLLPNMNAQTAEVANTETVTDAETTLVVKVKNVGCSTDIKTIQGKVEELEGVSKCVVVKKGAITSFDVSYIPGKVSVEAIHAAVEDTPGCANPNDRPYKVKIK